MPSQFDLFHSFFGHKLFWGVFVVVIYTSALRNNSCAGLILSSAPMIDDDDSLSELTLYSQNMFYNTKLVSGRLSLAVKSVNKAVWI